MAWLAMKMWLNLLLAFLLGITCGWLLFWRHRNEVVDEGILVEHSDFRSATRITERQQRAEQFVDDENIHSRNNAEPDKHADDERDENDTMLTDRIVREYGNVPPKRKKIYERDLADTNSDKDDAGVGDSLYDLPDRQPPIAKPAIPSQDTSARNLDDVAGFETNQNHPIIAKAPKLLSAPMRGPADPLQDIRGIGPTLERTLNAKGIYYFDQIAAWSDDHVAWIERDIDFPGRVRREAWVEQAIERSSQHKTTPPTAEIEPSIHQPFESQENPFRSSQGSSGNTPADSVSSADQRNDNHKPADNPNIGATRPTLLTPTKTQPSVPVQTSENTITRLAHTPSTDVPMTAMDRLIANKKLAKRS